MKKIDFLFNSSQLLTSYALATSGALATALTFNRLVKVCY